MKAEPDVVARPIDPDRLAELEEERTFLLRSLRDLDAEHDAGDVDEHDYTTLRDGYTKRAADVLRQIDAGRARLPTPRSRPWPRRLAVAGVTLAVATGVGWFVARSSGERLAGDEITGDVPNDVASMLAEARFLLGTDPRAAAELYGDVLDLRPGHAEALTYSGWLLYVVGRQSPDDDVVDAAADGAREKLLDAVESDPEYPDAHCFLAIIASEHDDDDGATAQAEAETCLAFNPPAQVRDLIEPYLD